jgi:MFS family permease
VAFIGGYFAAFFILRAVWVIPTMYIVSWIGPKHTILWSNLLYIPALILLWFVPEAGMMPLVGALLFKSISNSFHDVAYLVDFSKVKHVEHAGKELGYMHIFEKIATAVSPLLGGFVAFIFGPQVTLILAALLFALAAAPLFFTAEPLPTRQKITLKGFPIRHLWRNLYAEGAVAFSNEGSNGSTWALFILIVVLGTTGNAAYAEIGTLSAISLVASLAVSYAFGVLIDRRRGGELLKFSVIGNALLHMLRPFLPNSASVAVMNMASEITTTGYKMPFIRGMFDEADMKAGFRIVYLATMSAALCIGAALANLVLMWFALGFGEKQGIGMVFYVTAGVTLLIAAHGFSLYRRARSPV